MGGQNVSGITNYTDITNGPQVCSVFGNHIFQDPLKLGGSVLYSGMRAGVISPLADQVYTTSHSYSFILFCPSCGQDGDIQRS